MSESRDDGNTGCLIIIGIVIILYLADIKGAIQHKEQPEKDKQSHIQKENP